MAIKKSELYSSLWASCDALRGGMDASQYKDYVLVLLFIKYVSDKYDNDPNALIEIPKGGSFKDIAKLKGQKDIGEKIDTVIGALAKKNDLKNVIDVVSFNDEDKLGKGKEMIDRLSELVAIFENPALDFSKNRAEGDDILGDAYEYLMRHFATESGKSKGQFYTPAEVSRVIAKVIGIKDAKSQSQTIYDPTCGSGSLMLKAVDEAEVALTIYGQEKDVTTAALARMNMILHNCPTAEITKGQSTLSNPLFFDKHGYLKTFDYVVANPPFSLKNWTNGFDPGNDEHERFKGYGIPPEKNGDYAFLLHIVRSLKSTGKGACILPHGVLFRGGAEAEIRKNLIEKKYIKGIIGLPANLFYGTGIPACIIVIDKEGAANRKGIFLIDAGKGFIKDGNKNRLQEKDIHKIVDVFNKQIEIPKYSRLVSFEEISNTKNEYNLNIPRYIDSQEPEDIQDIEAHLLGDIPNTDIQALNEYWTVYPSLNKVLFGNSKRKGYSHPKVDKDHVKQTIFTHPEFVAFSAEMDKVFNAWKTRSIKYLKGLAPGINPKRVIYTISEDILKHYTDRALLDKYDIYQHLLNYWNETMQDDCYLIAVDGWKAEPYRIIEKNKKTGKETDKGWTCDLVPPALIIDKYFSTEKMQLEQLEAEKEALKAQQQELEEEHGGDEGYFAEMDKINRANVVKRLKEIDDKPMYKKTKPVNYSMAAEPTVKYGKVSEEKLVMEQYLDLIERQGKLSVQIILGYAELDRQALQQYEKLGEEDIKQLVVRDKWMTAIEVAVKSEMNNISQRLAGRIRELVERYDIPLPVQKRETSRLENKVASHLTKMGFVWN